MDSTAVRSLGPSATTGWFFGAKVSPVSTPLNFATATMSPAGAAEVGWVSLPRITWRACNFSSE